MKNKIQRKDNFHLSPERIDHLNAIIASLTFKFEQIETENVSREKEDSDYRKYSTEFSNDEL